MLRQADVPTKGHEAGDYHDRDADEECQVAPTECLLNAEATPASGEGAGGIERCCFEQAGNFVADDIADGTSGGSGHHPHERGDE